MTDPRRRGRRRETPEEAQARHDAALLRRHAQLARRPVTRAEFVHAWTECMRLYEKSKAAARKHRWRRAVKALFRRRPEPPA